MPTTEKRYNELTAAKWLARYRSLMAIDRTKPCKYGHNDCSIRERGACMNEILSEHPELDDEQQD
jgi:hypothetical protein